MPGKIVRLLFAFLLFVPLVNADPIQIPTGTITVLPTGGTGARTEPFVLTGTNFQANISNAAGNFQLGSCSAIPGFNPPCNTVNGSWVSIGSDNFGTFTLNGTTYPANVLNQISFFVNTFDIVIPPELQNAPGVLATAPFTFSALIATDDGQTASLIGEGTFSVLLRQMTSGSFTGLYFERATYTFGTAPEGNTVQAVPEPATILLLISGLAGAGVFRRSRRQA